MSVMEEIANRIGQFDENLMANRQSRTLKTLQSIYHLKHDLLHLRILFNPLKEIISRLQRATFEDQYIPYPRLDPSLRLGIKHFIVRRKKKRFRLPNTTDDSSMPLTSIYLNEYIQVYLNDLNHHINQLIDFLEIQRESVSILMSFWATLNTNETQEILNFLMMITVLFMPCNLLTAMHATNFNTQPQYQYRFGYFILLALLACILLGMIIWYKVKRWI